MLRFDASFFSFLLSDPRERRNYELKGFLRFEEDMVTLEKKPPAKAPPPLHSVALLSLVALFCLISLPSPSSMDEMLEAFTKTSFDWVTVKMLATVRLAFAAVCVGTTFRVIFFET